MVNIVSRIKLQLSALYDKNEVESFVSLLLEHIFGITTKERLMGGNTAITPEKMQLLDIAIERLKHFEPIQYILGKTEFYSLPYSIDRRALIPRPETEELIDWILHQCPDARTILDIGTGSGCIAVSLAHNMPKAKVSAMDISTDALSLARSNASANNVTVDFIEYDILNQSTWQYQYDVIVSNPPYIRLSEQTTMSPNVLDYEPHSALFVSDDQPLVFYHAIAYFALKQLNNSGMLFFEINRCYGREIVEMLDKMGFDKIELKKDISQNDRFIKCRLQRH